ncbi:uncharacterized protein LOC128875218 [Hylaeus volcanicus]|uniref:uncharacterized protein LOC128875218 n=1 Tax=Hylaeus volcanicus TaxID=313075 RepID=UPI0023B7DB2D|nr:uncharacterized protein LOC128875218 [Hylaeus volcanicus]
MRGLRTRIPNRRSVHEKFDMSLPYSKDFSIAISSFFMKCVGIWSANNSAQQRSRNVMLIYTVFTILFAVWIQTRDLYYSWGDFGTCTYIGCNILCLNMALFKIFILFLNKVTFLDLVDYMQTNFWQSNYAPNEQIIFASWTRVCTYFICFFTFFTEASIICYVIRPVVANIGRNESDRILPFNMWLDLPLSITPYFEITFILQVLSLYHVGVCYICCDNFLCIMNLHVAGQFRILQYRLKSMRILRSENEKHENSKAYPSKQYHAIFRSCIQQHQALIEYCDKLEKVFRIIVLAQVLIFSVLICFVGYQVVLADLSSTTRRVTFVNLLTSTMCQLFMFTYSCDCLIRESTNVATAIYATPWLDLSMDKYGRLIRKDMQLVVMRTYRPCCLTANGFFPVSLQTYTNILSTAMSYFTLLKRNTFLCELNQETFITSDGKRKIQHLAVESGGDVEKHFDDISIAMTSFFMKACGIWMATNNIEQQCRKIAIAYTTIVILFQGWVLTSAVYFSGEDFNVFLTNLSALLSMLLPTFKTLILFAHRKDLFQLVVYLERKFLQGNYDAHEKSLFAYHVALCYMCFDNILCIMNLHVASQFRILQYRLENMREENKEESIENSKKSSSRTADENYAIFKSCVRQHQTLIAYCDKLDDVFSLFSLGQVLIFSTLICIDGYQVVMPGTPFAYRFLFGFHMLSCTSQLFMFTYSCDCLLKESMNIAPAMYAAPWTHLPMNKDGRMLRKDLILVIMRSRIPCCVTAHGFFPVSMETFTKIMSTAMSYFTLIQGQTADTTSVSELDDISIAVTSFFMKACGIWMATNYDEQRCRNIAVAYTLTGMVFHGCVLTSDLYFVREDFEAFLLTLCNYLSLLLPFFKIIILFTHRKDIFHLVVYLQRNFLQGCYNVHEKKIVDACKRACAFFICTFTCCANATVFSYIITPVFVNIGKNETDRMLPFHVSIDTVSITPYFEIAFVLQSLALYQVGVCYFCFDNLLCIMNLHVANQFRILQYRLENMQSIFKEKHDENSKFSPDTAHEYYEIFKSCVQYHQALIAYCAKLEEVFSLFSLGQVLVFSSLICLDGYQILMSDAPPVARMTFVFHIVGCTAQLFMFTYSCDCLIQYSTSVVSGMYAAPWPRLPMNEDGRMLRKDLILVMLRSKVPCCLTARKFFAVSLETYTGIMSTAVSYFTLLKQRTSATT